MKIPQPQEQPQTEKPSVPNQPVTPQKPEQPQKPNQSEKPMTDTGSGNKVLPLGTVLQDQGYTGMYRIISSGTAAPKGSSVCWSCWE